MSPTALVLLLGVAGVLALACAPPPRQTGFVDRTVIVAGREHRYQVYVPREWTPEARLPVVLFLHGAGERGEDGLVQTDVGIGTAIRRHPERFPALVVMPQCLRDRTWNDPEMVELALAALDRSLREFSGDPLRVSLTGLSMGGYGTWHIAARHPGRFSALGVICGGIRPPGVLRSAMSDPTDDAADPYAGTAERIGGTPVWVFHGADDGVVPVSESRRMVRALEAAGGDVRYTEYEGVGHDSWVQAYADRDFIAWLLSQQLPLRGPM